MTSITENENCITKQNKTSTVKKIATLTGCAVIGMAPTSLLIRDTFFKPATPEKAQKTATSLRTMMKPIDTFENVENVAQEIIHKEGLDKKGIKLLIADDSETFRESWNKITKNSKLETYYNNLKITLQNGGNAAFEPQTKSVIIDRQNAYTSVFHELGHADNYNSSKFFDKVLTYGRRITPGGISLVAPIALGIALFHNVDKTKENKSGAEKTLDFVAENAGKLTLLSYVPLLAEEARASKKGINFAKKYLPETKPLDLAGSGLNSVFVKFLSLLNESKADKIKSLCKGYRFAWVTYLLTAGLVAGTVGLASIIKDKIINDI